MNAPCPAGARAPLEVRIRRKAFRAANGGEAEVLNDIAFDLAPGSFTVLIGPSGCGKTTTLRILLGLDCDFEGELRRPQADMRMAAVFQEPRLLPWRTVEQNIRLGLPPGDRGDLGPLLHTLELNRHKACFPAELSLGQQRRVALARAFAVLPDLLVLDEPFVSLDEATADRMRDLLLKLWRQRAATVVMVTHNLREAALLGDRLLFIGGRPARIRNDVAMALPRTRRAGPEFEHCLERLARLQAPGDLPV